MLRDWKTKKVTKEQLNNSKPLLKVAIFAQNVQFFLLFKFKCASDFFPIHYFVFKQY